MCLTKTSIVFTHRYYVRTMAEHICNTINQPTLFHPSPVRSDDYVPVVFAFPVHLRLGFPGGPAPQPYGAAFHCRATGAFDVVFVHDVRRDPHVQVSGLKSIIHSVCIACAGHGWSVGGGEFEMKCTRHVQKMRFPYF